MLVDSSVWIASSSSKTPEFWQLRALIQKDELIEIALPIHTEVCQGAKTPDEFHKLWNALLGFSHLEIQDKHWGISAWNYFLARKQGITLSTMDCLIGTLAAEYRTPLWTLDKNLQRAASILRIELYKPKSPQKSG